MIADEHVPVMAGEVIEALSINPDGKYIDCTFGRGGHSQLILRELTEAGQLLAIDRDREAEHSKVANLLVSDNRFEFAVSAFSALQALVEARGWCGEISGILFDLGISSPQIDNAVRGFSFRQDGPLDMRMDTTSGTSAAEWIARVSEEELARVLKCYGEEKFSRRIAQRIVDSRKTTAIGTTRQLAHLIEESVPFREKNKHPATRSFQAIRIHINNELEELQAGLLQAVNILKPGGRLVVIAFHSLEDRIVKRFIRKEAIGGEFPKGIPVMATDYCPRLSAVGKAKQPQVEEVLHNVRARSAILRVAERVG